jgi:hypothetical protein
MKFLFGLLGAFSLAGAEGLELKNLPVLPENAGQRLERFNPIRMDRLDLELTPKQDEARAELLAMGSRAKSKSTVRFFAELAGVVRKRPKDFSKRVDWEVNRRFVALLTKRQRERIALLDGAFVWIRWKGFSIGKNPAIWEGVTNAQLAKWQPMARGASAMANKWAPLVEQIDNDRFIQIEALFEIGLQARFHLLLDKKQIAKRRRQARGGDLYGYGPMAGMKPSDAQLEKINALFTKSFAQLAAVDTGKNRPPAEARAEFDRLVADLVAKFRALLDKKQIEAGWDYGVFTKRPK